MTTESIAESVVPAPALKTAPVKTVEVKSGEVAHSDGKIQGDAPVIEPNALAPEKDSENVCAICMC